MTLTFRFWPIFVGGAIVQNGVVVNELHVTYFQRHIQTQVGLLRDAYEQFDRLFRVARRIWMPCDGTDVPIGKRHRQQSVVIVEHRHAVPLGFALAYFTAAIERNRLKQARCQIRAPLCHFVVDGH